jgi:uncharacterized protein YecE (DUF72 family)
MAKVFIGTSGWFYDDWWGRFYPKNLPKGKALEFYSKTFDTVELNASFYHLPKKITFENWRKNTPTGFTFSVKGNRFITQNLKLSRPNKPVERFFKEVKGLEKKLEGVLWQLPPNFGKDLERLEEFLKILPKNTKNAFEFRHKSWLSADIYKSLEKHKAGWVIQSSKKWPAAEVITSNFIYLRFHGIGSLYSSDYSDKELKEWAEKINKWLKEGLDVYAYFNNDDNVNAVKNSLKLKELIKK